MKDDGGLSASMTLRDWFAGMAMYGLGVYDEPDPSAQRCYTMADAMIAARSGKAHPNPAEFALHKSGVIVEGPRSMKHWTMRAEIMGGLRSGETDEFWMDADAAPGDPPRVLVRRVCETNSGHSPDACPSRFQVVREGAPYETITLEEWRRKYAPPANSAGQPPATGV